MGGGIFLMDPVRYFHFDHTWIWTGMHCISSHALYHWATETSAFHLWHFNVFNLAAEGLVLVYFWFDLWEIFFLAKLGFVLEISGL